MNHSDSLGQQANSEAAQAVSAASLWDRLRDSMERLAALGQDRANPQALAQKLAARAALLRGRIGTAESAEVPLVFLAFNKGQERYGIAIDQVLEVQALEHFSPVPQTPPWLPGVIHWRGLILALLDLGKLFGVPESGLSDVHASVIVEAAGRRIAVVAREIEDLLSTTASQLKPAPELPGSIPHEWIAGVRDDNRMILRMDVILQDGRFLHWRQE